LKPDNWQKDYAPEERIAKEINEQMKKAERVKFAEENSSTSL